MKKLEFKTTYSTMSYNGDPLLPLSDVRRQFDEWYAENIEQAPVVYGQFGTLNWYDSRYLEDTRYQTHQARLIDIREIEKKECEHEPRVDGDGWNCRYCHKPLKPKGGWELA